MAQVLVVYVPGLTALSAKLVGWYYCLPGENENTELTLAAAAEAAQGRSSFIVTQATPETLNHDAAVALVALNAVAAAPT